MKTIAVPFDKKRKARECGIIFDIRTRQWLLPDTLTPLQETFLKELENNQPTADKEFAVEKFMEIPLEIVESITKLSSVKNSSVEDSDNEEIWKEALTKDDTLWAAMIIRDYGLPKKEETRTELLKILSKRRESDYAITYDAMCGCSKEFAQTYPINEIARLIRENVTAQNRYTEEIRSSVKLSEEQKALLLFALPI